MSSKRSDKERKIERFLVGMLFTVLILVFAIFLLNIFGSDKVIATYDDENINTMQHEIKASEVAQEKDTRTISLLDNKNTRKDIVAIYVEELINKLRESDYERYMNEFASGMCEKMGYRCKQKDSYIKYLELLSEKVNQYDMNYVCLVDDFGKSFNVIVRFSNRKSDSKEQIYDYENGMNLTFTVYVKNINDRESYSFVPFNMGLIGYNYEIYGLEPINPEIMDNITTQPITEYEPIKNHIEK